MSRPDATRYDRNGLNYLAVIKLASTRLWPRLYESAAQMTGSPVYQGFATLRRSIAACRKSLSAINSFASVLAFLPAVPLPVTLAQSLRPATLSEHTAAVDPFPAPSAHKPKNPTLPAHLSVSHP